MERIVVLGGTGFIGSNLVSYLKDKGHYVRCIGKDVQARLKQRGSLFNKADEVYTADLRNPSDVAWAIKDMDWVIHLAADMGGVGYFHKQDYHPFINNMQIDINVLTACEKQKIKRLFYASSACIYPTHLQMEEGNAPKLSEDMIYPANSDQMYGWEKLMTTMLCQRAPFDCRIGVFHTIFGPAQEIEGERMKFPTAIAMKACESKKTGKPIEIWGNGKQIRSFLYIDDALEKIYRVLTAEENHTPINIGSEEAVSVIDCANMCCDILDTEKNFVYNDAQPSGVLARNCDNTQFEKYYEIKNKYTTKEGFTKLIEWIQNR